MGAVAEQCVLSARWLFPVAGPPLEHGTITLQHGRIVAVLPHGERTADIDLGNAALLPGLVNAHTHLDLTGMQNTVRPDADFVGWLRRVIAQRMRTTAEATQSAIQEGIRQVRRAGTTLVGDIAGMGASWEALCAAPLRAMCFRELLGLTPTRAHQAWQELVAWANQRPDTPRCRLAVSPHAPYSVHKALIEAAARLWPVCVHLAESPHEAELLEQHTGPFVPFLEERGVWHPDGLAPSWDWLVWRSSRASLALFTHGNYLPTTMHLPPNTSLVYCPRTHAAFSFAPHPYRDFMRRGVRIALGTDSLASNPDLDVLQEARYLRQRDAELSGTTLLRMLTLNGAEALGFDREVGTLTAGKQADLVAVPLADESPNDPHDLLFTAPLPNAVRRVWLDGVEVTLSDSQKGVA